MATFANIQAVLTDSPAYCTAQVITSSEADLGTPFTFAEMRAILAVLQFNMIGGFVQCYVVMQTDLGDGVWVDVAWCLYSTTSPQTFTLAGGPGLALSPGAQRVSGTAPTSNGANNIPLGMRIRFVGKVTSSSSGSPSGQAGGVGPVATVTIKTHIMGLK